MKSQFHHKSRIPLLFFKELPVKKGVFPQNFYTEYRAQSYTLTFPHMILNSLQNDKMIR